MLKELLVNQENLERKGLQDHLVFEEPQEKMVKLDRKAHLDLLVLLEREVSKADQESRDSKDCQEFKVLLENQEVRERRV